MKSNISGASGSEAVIQCSFDFDLENIYLPAPTPEKSWRTTKQLSSYHQTYIRGDNKIKINKENAHKKQMKNL